MLFETLIEHYHDEIYRYLWRLLASASQHDQAVLAEDLTQEVFIRAYRAFDRLRADSNYRAWLYKIATNCAYTALKRGRKRATVALNEAITGGAPDHTRRIEQAETQASIQHAINNLPPRQQTAVTLRYLQELSYEEISAIMECSQETARANVSQGIRRLRNDEGLIADG